MKTLPFGIPKLMVSSAASMPAYAGGFIGTGGTFSDDDGSVHDANIEAIAEVGVTRGCNPEGTLYCPVEFVTRGQMAAFIARILDLSPAAKDFFTDDNGNTHEDSINRIAEIGVTRGCNPEGTLYCPAEFVTRGQMAAFIVRAAEYEDGAGADLFSDDDGSIFEEDIDKLATAGVTKGCNPERTLYCPRDFATRGQRVSFIAHAASLDPIEPPPPTTTTNAGPGTTSSTTSTSTTSPATTTTAVPGDGDPFAGVPPPQATFESETPSGDATCRNYTSSATPLSVVQEYANTLTADGWDVGDVLSTGPLYEDCASFSATKAGKSMQVNGNGSGGFRSALSVCITALNRLEAPPIKAHMHYPPGSTGCSAAPRPPR